MKNIKKLVATLGLLGIIIMTASSAQAGLIMAGRTAPTSPTVNTKIFNSIRNIVIGQLTGVTVQDTEGIMFSDQATERTPVYITD